MADETQDTRAEGFIPVSFEDLRRTKPGSASLDPAEQVHTRRDLAEMASDRRFMQTSKLISICAAAIGLLLILVAYAHPLFDTVDAVQTASSVAAQKAGQGVDAAETLVGGVADKAAFVQSTDTKAINVAKGGLACLNGKAACTGGATTPFK